METKRKIKTTKETTPTPPRWVPKPPPPPSAWDRIRFLLRRSLFPIVVLLFAGALIVFLMELPGFGVSMPGSEGQQQATENESVNTSASEPGAVTDPAASDETVALSVTSTPAGARVLLDGEEVGTTPLNDVSVARGAYILSLDLENHRMPDTLVVLRSGAPSSFSFRMRPMVPPEEEPVAASEQQEQPTQEPEAADEPPAQQQTQDEQPPQTDPEPVEEEPPVTQEEETSGEEQADEEVAIEEERSEEDFAMGSIVVSSDPRGATVLLDGVRRGTTPITLNDLEVGTKQVTVQLDGHVGYTEEIEVVPEQVQTVFATLSPLQGTLRVLARPWGSIYINGELHEAETNVRYSTELPVGTHTVRVEHPTLGTQERQVTVTVGEVTSIVIDLNQ